MSWAFANCLGHLLKLMSWTLNFTKDPWTLNLLKDLHIIIKLEDLEKTWTFLKDLAKWFQPSICLWLNRLLNVSTHTIIITDNSKLRPDRFSIAFKNP